MMSQSKICAVVVTYNRLELLKLCIESLKKQTRSLDEILIINNSSTDGTEEWLKKQNDLVFITQENTGGAGGFHTGIKTAYEKGFDWIWCMDDDCEVDSKALENLTKYTNCGFSVLNCIVFTSHDKSKILKGLYESKTKNYFNNITSIKNNVIESARFFNGTLIASSVVDLIGFPIIELFIHGDEVEYYERIRSRKISIATICDSKLYHPEPKYFIIKNYFFLHIYEFLDSVKRYYQARNSIYIIKKYPNRSLINFLKTLVLNFYCIIFINKNKEVLKSYVKGLVDGVMFTPKNKVSHNINDK